MKRLLSVLWRYNLCELAVLLFFKLSKKNRYVYSRRENVKWVYISYIPETFFRRHDQLYLNTHQNKRESLAIGQVFADNGFNYVVESFDSISSDNRKYDIVFGLEPNFCELSKRNIDALKIYYATGSYYKHQNSMVKLRTDSFNANHSSHVPYYRTVTEHNACELADFIFQIGSQYTLETYPKSISSKISLLEQSSNFYKSISLERKLLSYNRYEFLWLGGGGSILKGLDLVLDFFCQHEKFKLHIVGSIDKEVAEYCDKKLIYCSNIHFHGFMDLNTDVFLNLAEKISFGLFPSASEGGAPGSVISSMKCGIIPITSKYAAFDDIDQLGFMLNDFTVDAIEESIQWTIHLTEDEISNLIMKNHKYAAKWSLDNFRMQFNFILKNTIESYICEHNNS